MKESCFVVEAVQSAWRSKLAVFCPIFMRLMRGCVQLGLILALGCIMFVSPGVVSGGHVNEQGAIAWGIVVGFLVTGWAFFSAACRLFWWRYLAEGCERHDRKERWIRDLPAIMGIDLIYIIGEGICILGVFGGIYEIIVNGGFWGVILSSLSALMCLLCSIIKPAVMAEQVALGGGIASSTVRGFKDLVHAPLKGLAVWIVPDIGVLVFYGAAICEMLIGKLAIAAILVTLGLILSWIRPVFWTEFAHQSQK